MRQRKGKSQPDKGSADPSKRMRQLDSLFSEAISGTTVKSSALYEPKLPPWVGE